MTTAVENAISGHFSDFNQVTTIQSTDLFEYFHISRRDISVGLSDEILYVSVKLKDRDHIYHSGSRININSLDLAQDDLNGIFFCYPSKGISLAFIFYDCDDVRLDSMIMAPNQKTPIIIPEDTRSMVLSLRISEEYKYVINALHVGSSNQLQVLVKNAMCFDYSCINSQITNQNVRISSPEDNEPLIILESVFCDTENNDDVIHRYLSFFIASIYQVSIQSYKNYIWAIYISDDKENVANTIKEYIHLFGISEKVEIIFFTHPPDGYSLTGNAKTDEFIMRRPNIRISSRREMLFTKMLNVRESLNNHSGLVIRLALDDDDFFASNHFEDIAKIAMKYEYMLVAHKAVAIGLTRLIVAYHYVQKIVEIHEVDFTKFMTGNKFLISDGIDYKLSPFSIPESFRSTEGYVNNGIYYKVEKNNLPGFIYNRHGINFSNSNKQFYCDHTYRITSYASHDEFLHSLNTYE